MLAAMGIKEKLNICLIGNIATLVIVLLCVILFNSDSTYCAFGPSRNLVVISVHISTWSRYAIMLGIITVVNIVEVMSEELGTPILGFSVYNPDKKVITEFTRTELQMYANSMYFISDVRYVLMMQVAITQIDIAMYSVIVKKIANAIAIRMLLNEKQFLKESSISHELLEVIVN